MSRSDTKLQKYSAPALEKGLDILEFLSVTNGSPTLSQLAAGIDRSKNEIFRMMIVLEERGYIQRTDGEIYSLTDKLAHIGNTRSDSGKLAELASPYLERLSDETSLSNHLSIQQNNRLLTIATAEAANSYGLSVQVGYQHGLFGTAAGACFLASADDESIRRNKVREISDGRPAEAIEAFVELVENCRKYSAVQAPNPKHNSIIEIAAPVRQVASDQTIAAIAIPMILSNENSNRLTETKERLKAASWSLQEKISVSLPAKLLFA